MAKAKTYKSSDGDYLTVRDLRDGWQIAWFIPEDDDFGMVLGEGGSGASDEETAIAEDVIRQYMQRNSSNSINQSRVHGFYFEKLKEAQECLALINHALLNREVKWPDWAVQAQSAGWKPPKGWKP